MGLVQCMTCRLELPCQCSARVVTEAVESFKPRRSMAVPETLDLAATERLWQAMMREQRDEDGD